MTNPDGSRVSHWTDQFTTVELEMVKREMMDLLAPPTPPSSLAPQPSSTAVDPSIPMQVAPPAQATSPTGVAPPGALLPTPPGPPFAVPGLGLAHPNGVPPHHPPPPRVSSAQLVPESDSMLSATLHDSDSASPSAVRSMREAPFVPGLQASSSSSSSINGSRGDVEMNHRHSPQPSSSRSSRDRDYEEDLHAPRRRRTMSPSPNDLSHGSERSLKSPRTDSFRHSSSTAASFHDHDHNGIHGMDSQYQHQQQHQHQHRASPRPMSDIPRSKQDLEEGEIPDMV